ncbi:alpha-N-acetylgalactosaminide alpha-2,6-sialyltransferase 2-like isoform X2 [Patiria miniata]|nr:alpha-N-acetylgalactosaminide alpha-2,6-sialyltransferase 2-like isoform X2 [Patiria miniata]XP_038049366.1 alpha-N-acetylgalactosaminide alpha-2,6-sialyltransferase 2-like isoform X2 [Patiria miniata]XP_038049367.1 alpha-N-acetylgalactosaminide alpha-2,6-sialyltransferase 2-like isoform X2 [Patiria miniata]
MRVHVGKIVRNTAVIFVLATVLLAFLHLRQHSATSTSDSSDSRGHPGGINLPKLPKVTSRVPAPSNISTQAMQRATTLSAVETNLRKLSETHLVTFKNATPEFSFRQNDFFSPSTCPTSLQTRLSANTSWTSELYHPEIKQLLTSTNISRKEYQRLVTYWMPFGFKYHQNFTYEELIDVLNLFPKSDSIFDFTRQKSRPQCVSCAVVGNGGILNGSKMGKEIDGHDMVFRVNHCIRRGYEDDVGNRTTHLVLMDRSLRNTKDRDIPRDEGIKYVFMPCRKQDYRYVKEAATGRSPKLKLRVNVQDVRILHPDFIRYNHKIWENTRSFRPTTGGMMFFTALHAGCDSVSVYGMGFTGAYSEHYYDKSFVKFKNVKGSHDFKKEVSILKRLDQDGLIRWYKRDVHEFSARFSLDLTTVPTINSAENQSKLKPRQSYRRGVIRETPHQLYQNAPDLVKLRQRAGLSHHWPDKRSQNGIKVDNLSS